ncbi:hypothetical protein N7494_001726 [Penicillium frequentans]|uniref:Uncharacterized protein n=1 Tax=Penicillium frequentans TaxID=3151616 RepID=A0AAD6D2B2_9EURO|nr:hypothetical protein N7494_001726 [Penicillium glabrum]
MPPKQAKVDPRASTLLFKKHKITILLSLQPHEPLTAVKEKLLQALKSREVREIKGEPIPEDPALIELGIPVDRSELEKGWTRLIKAEPTITEGVAKGTGNTGGTVLSAGLENGHVVAFRFRRADEVEKDDGDWDVIIPSFDDEEEEI